MQRRITVPGRAAVLAAAAGLALTACGGGGPDGGDSGRTKPTSDSTTPADTKDDTTQDGTEDGGSDDDASGGGAQLQLGQAADKPVEVTKDDKTARFKVAVRKVVLGKPGDLDEASDDEKKFAGKIPAWLYVEYEHVGGTAPAEVSTSGDWGLKTAGGERGRPLIMIFGDLSSTPGDCTEDDDFEPFTAGQRETVCQPFVVPEGAEIDEALLSRGFTTPPTTWKVG